MAQCVDLQSFWPRGFCFPFQTAQKCVTLIWLHRSSGKEKESRCLVFWPSTKREIRHFHAVVLRWRQRNVQKSAMHVQIVFLRLQRGFPNIVLRKWIFTSIERELHVSTPYEFLNHVMSLREFPLSLYKICILIQLNSLKFERNGSLE